MTGPERETLSGLLRMATRIEAKLNALDLRVADMELADAKAIGVAAGAAAATAAYETQAAAGLLSRRALLSVGITAGIGVSSIVLKIIDSLQ